jgi:hypothetical protein
MRGLLFLCNRLARCASWGVINQAKRIDIWSRAKENEPYLHSYIDLEDVENGRLLG